MSTYDTYVPRMDDSVSHPVQIKTNATGKTYYPGSITPLVEGLHFGYEGAVYVRGCVFRGVIPYERMWDKWGEDILGIDIYEMIERGNPVKQALDSIKVDGWTMGELKAMGFFSVELPEEPPTEKAREAQLAAAGLGPGPAKLERKVEYGNLMAQAWHDKIMKTVAQVEWEMYPMKPYWMVHRRGKQSGQATAVHNSQSAAYIEAERLAKKENDSFTVLMAIGRVKPRIEVDHEPVYLGNDIPDALPKADCPCGCNHGTD